MAFTFDFDLEYTYTVTAHSVDPGAPGTYWQPPDPAEVDLGGPVRVWPGYGKRQKLFGSMAECTEWITFETFIREVMLYHLETEEQAISRLTYAGLQAYLEDLRDQGEDADDREPY